MNILILHGPNLNLLGTMSAAADKRITLDKINTALRRHVRNTDHTLKITQTHKVFQAINFIQRNRNWADGIIMAPMAWAKYELAVLETLSLVKCPVIQVLFLKGFGLVNDETDSIFTPTCRETIVGAPEDVYISALDALTSTD